MKLMMKIQTDVSEENVSKQNSDCNLLKKAGILAYSSIMKMQATNSSETSVDFQRGT
jgi:hypothetical protein